MRFNYRGVIVNTYNFHCNSSNLFKIKSTAWKVEQFKFAFLSSLVDDNVNINS